MFNKKYESINYLIVLCCFATCSNVKRAKVNDALFKLAQNSDTLCIVILKLFRFRAYKLYEISPNQNNFLTFSAAGSYTLFCFLNESLFSSFSSPLQHKNSKLHLHYLIRKYFRRSVVNFVPLKF